MESSRPRSVLAAFQERLQLASSKCGSLVEQLNIVRKKVEGEETMMEVSKSLSNHLIENVSKVNMLQKEKPNPLDCKDVFNKEKISGNSGSNISLDRDSKPRSFDEDSILNSCSSSNSDNAETTDKQKTYEELFKRLKDNEGKIFSKKNRSSSENSSSTISLSFKSNKSYNNNFSDCSVIEDKCEIDNLNATGVDYFLPSVTEKFQEIFYENSEDEPRDIYSKDKNIKVSFDSMFTTPHKTDSLSDEKLTEKKKQINISLQNKDPNENIIKRLIVPSPLKTHNNIHAFKRVRNIQQKTKEKDINCETASMKTKSETTKKSKKIINNSITKNIKLHSPEMTLYKKLKTAPAKFELKRSRGTVLKQKTIPVINSKEKDRTTTIDPKLKNVSEITKLETNTFAKKSNLPNESMIVKSNAKVSKSSVNELTIKNPSLITTYNTNYNENTNKKKVPESKEALNIQTKKANLGAKNSQNMERGQGDIISSFQDQVLKKKNVNKTENSVLSKEKQIQRTKNNTNFKTEQHKLLSNGFSKSERVSKIPLYNDINNKIFKEFPNKQTVSRNENEEILNENAKLKNNKKSNHSASLVQLPHLKKESSKEQTISSKKEGKLENRSNQTFKNNKTKDQHNNVREKPNLSKETIYTQNINDIKTLTASFPFILGQSTSKTFNVRAAIQQTVSMIVKSPAETLRRLSFSEMFNLSSKLSTQKSYSSYITSRKICPACVSRVKEDEEDLEDIPIDPWDTEYHNKFIKCSCMPRDTVDLKTVINQLLQDTNSYCPQSKSYQESELENGEENRVNNSFFRRNNNIYKLSKLLRIRDILKE